MLLSVAALGLLMAIVGLIARNRPPASNVLRHNETKLAPDWNWVGSVLIALGGVTLLVALIIFSMT